MVRILTILILNILIISNLFATHLVGGNLAYEFVGIQPNGDFRYNLKLNYYFDCGSASNWQPPNIPQNMSVGFMLTTIQQIFIPHHLEAIQNMVLLMLIWSTILRCNNILK